MRSPIVDTADAIKKTHCYITVRYRRVTRWRLRVGTWLFRVAGSVMGFGSTTIAVEDDTHS